MASGSESQTPAPHPQKSPKPRIDTAKANVNKRQPRKLPKRQNDVYVTRKSNFAAQMEKCEKLLDKGERELHIHGLGAAINRALNLALQLEARGLGTLQLAISTATVDLVDDIEPLCDEEDFDTRERSNSAVHIRVFRTENKSKETAGKWNRILETHTKEDCTHLWYRIHIEQKQNNTISRIWQFMWRQNTLWFSSFFFFFFLGGGSFIKKFNKKLGTKW